MFNESKLQAVLKEYKKYLASSEWETGKKSEKFKWQAVKHFKDNWDIDAPDFADMLSRSLEKTGSLLNAAMYFPQGMIVEFAEAFPEETREMFRVLFDETVDITKRITNFKGRSAELLKKIGKTDKNHYQDEHAATTYLWLRYPDKHYIYKLGEVSKVAKELNSDCKFIQGHYEENIRNFYNFYDELCNEIKKDTELISLLRERLTDDCDKDVELKTLTVDVGFFISRYYNDDVRTYDNSKPVIWKISHGSDGRGVPNDLKGVLMERQVVTVNSKTAAIGKTKSPQGEEFMKRIKSGDYFYLCYGKVIQLVGKFISDYTAICLDMKNAGKNDWFERKYEVIAKPKIKKAYKGKVKRWTPNANSTCVEIEKDEWDSFEELILKPYFDMTIGELMGNANTQRGYWWLNANPKIWSFSSLEVGKSQFYTLYNNGHKRRIFQNFIDAKQGDLVIGYESTPAKKIVALGRISKEQDGEKIFIEKTEGLSVPIEYSVLKDNPDLAGMEFFQNPQGSLFKLTEDEYNTIIDIIRDENPLRTNKKTDAYSEDDFLKDVYISDSDYETLRSLLLTKKNIILQGAPGVGKTFAARRLAWSIMSEQDDDRVEFVQFHQNYSYEDFVMGYKPSDKCFELKYGTFHTFCNKARNYPKKEFFFIIDEINRGNLSKIFGELLMLIESDYRGTKATLAYGGEQFSVPDNLYIIGMMNTADRSLAMIDYALRRRFSFYDMKPAFDNDKFKAKQNEFNSDKLNALIEKIKELNEDIRKDKTLGEGFCIGHSYFCKKPDDIKVDKWLELIVKFDIIPTLKEYWFDNEDKAEDWEKKLLGVLK